MRRERKKGDARSVPARAREEKVPGEVRHDFDRAQGPRGSRAQPPPWPRANSLVPADPREAVDVVWARFRIAGLIVLWVKVMRFRSGFPADEAAAASARLLMVIYACLEFF